ncbi:N-alpha-acetyltransferase 40 (N-acetyltransferase 11) (N-alpha-acetyltransferase D) (NatD), partial [Durusdinium trenchii]
MRLTAGLVSQGAVETEIIHRVVESLVEQVVERCVGEARGAVETEMELEMTTTATATTTATDRKRAHGEDAGSNRKRNRKKMVNERVRVYWKHERGFFDGLAKESHEDRVLVAYDNGESAWELAADCEIIATEQKRKAPRKLSDSVASSASSCSGDGHDVSTVPVSPPEWCDSSTEDAATNAPRRSGRRKRTSKRGRDDSCAKQNMDSPLKRAFAGAPLTGSPSKLRVTLHGVDVNVPISSRGDDLLPISEIKHYTSASIPNDVSEEIFLLTKANMETMQNESNWEDWDDIKKQQELITTPGMHFFVIYSDSIQSSMSRIDEDDALMVCQDVLDGLVNCVISGAEKPDAAPRRRPRGDIIGYMAVRSLVEIKWHVLYVHELHLVDGARKRGIGKFMMHHIEEIAKQLRIQYIMLTVLQVNQKAQRFYRDLGFHVDEACPSYCYQSERHPYRILSKMIDTTILRHTCAHCADVGFRYYESLIMHGCLVHGGTWPYRCRVPGCNLGSVKREQLRLHAESHGPQADGNRFVSSQRSQAANRVVVAPKEKPGAPRVPKPPQAPKPASPPSIAGAAAPTSSDLLFQSVTMLKTGLIGKILRTKNGSYWVRLDGENAEEVRARRPDFVLRVPKNKAFAKRCASDNGDASLIDISKILPPKQVRREPDPDFLFAMQLHHEEWVSARPKNLASSAPAHTGTQVPGPLHTTTCGLVRSTTRTASTVASSVGATELAKLCPTSLLRRMR